MSTLMMALNRVKTLARTISPKVRDDRWSLTLTLPSATRWATSAAVSPRGASGRVGVGHARSTLVGLLSTTIVRAPTCTGSPPFKRPVVATLVEDVSTTTSQPSP